MSENIAAQIETCVISDSELDNISGGVAAATFNAAGYGASVGVGDVVGAARSQVGGLPVAPLTGLVAVQTTPGL